MQVVEIPDLNTLEGGAYLLGDHLDGLQRPHLEEVKLQVIEVSLVLHRPRNDGQGRALAKAHL